MSVHVFVREGRRERTSPAADPEAETDADAGCGRVGRCAAGLGCAPTPATSGEADAAKREPRARQINPRKRAPQHVLTATARSEQVVPPTDRIPLRPAPTGLVRYFMAIV